MDGVDRVEARDLKTKNVDSRPQKIGQINASTNKGIKNNAIYGCLYIIIINETV